MHIFEEGQFGSSHTQIGYPRISSCVTVTAYTERELLMGFHAVAEPKTGQPSFEELAMELRRYASSDCLRAVIVGDLSNEKWDPTKLTDIARMLNLDVNDLTVTTVNTAEFGRGSFDVVVDKTRWHVLDRSGNAPVCQGNELRNGSGSWE